MRGKCPNIGNVLYTYRLNLHCYTLYESMDRSDKRIFINRGPTCTRAFQEASAKELLHPSTIVIFGIEVIRFVTNVGDSLVLLVSRCGGTQLAFSLMQTLVLSLSVKQALFYFKPVKRIKESISNLSPFLVF